LAEEARPWATHQEITGYCYPVREDGKPIKDEPIKMNDHGVDAMRFMAVYVRDYIGYEATSTLDRPPAPHWGPKSYGVQLRHNEVLGNGGKRIYRGKVWRQGRLVDAPKRTQPDHFWRSR
jgi:hypothetical protein